MIRRLIGVYDADGTMGGELRYWVGARLGRAHCSLCEITHGLVRERADWRECRADLPVEFETYHRNDQPAMVRDATRGITPCVVAETSDGVVGLLGPAELEECIGSPERLVESLHLAVERAGLAWPEPGG